MKKIINFRPIFLTALSLAVGIFTARFYPTIGWSVFVVPSLAVAAVALLYFFFFGYEKKNGRKVFFYSVFFAFVCLFGSASLLTRVFITENKEVAGTRVLTGEICEYYEDEDGVSVILANCRADGEKIADVYVADYTGIGKLYDKVTASCDLSPIIISGGSYGKLLLRGVGMKAVITEEKSVSRSERLAAKFYRFSKEVFSRGMPEREAKVATAMFTGATGDMAEELSWYRATGLAHVFAVSGLHVGLLFAAVGYILSLCHAKKLLKAVISGAVVLFYAYLCGLSASCLRAATMCICYAVTSAIGEKKDRLNAFFAAFIIALAVNPADMFTVGFILSFGVSFSIIAVAPYIKRSIKFLPEKTAGSLAVIISANLFAAPIMILNFGGFPLIAVVTNLILLPLLVFVYYLLWIAFVLGGIFAGATVVFAFIPRILLYGTDELSSFISGHSHNIVYFPALTPLYYASLYASSDMVNSGKVVKAVCIFIPVTTLVVCAALSFAL